MNKKLLTVITTVLFFGIAFVTNFTQVKAYSYLQTPIDYSQEDTRVVFEQELTGPATINELGITTVAKYGANNAFRMEILPDDQLNRNVLSLRSSSVATSSSRAQFKTGQLAPTVTDGSTGNSTALHLSLNFANPKMQVFYLQAYSRQGGVSSGSNTNTGNLLQIKWVSGVGTQFFFGNGNAFTSATSPLEVENTYKVFEDFQLNTWYDFVLLFNDKGSASEDSLEIYVNGELQFTKVGLTMDFNQNISDLILDLQSAKTSDLEANTLRVANLFTSRYNPVASVEAKAPITVTEGETFTYEPTIIGEDANHKATIDQYDVELSNAVLTYNELTRQFTAKEVETSTPVDITYTLRAESDVPYTVTQTVTVEPSFEAILPTEIVRQGIISDGIELLTNEVLPLDALFTVLPAIATDQTFTYTIKDDSTSIAKIENNQLIGVAEGTVTLVATANGDSSLQSEVEVHVQKGYMNSMNDFTQGTEWDVADASLYQDGWSARGYSKVFGTIQTVEDDLFGIVPQILGAGSTANAGGSYLEHLVSISEITADKDYRLRGYYKVDGTALGSMHVDVKAYVMKSLEEGLASIDSSNLPYFTQIKHSNLGNGWMYFETEPVNADVLAGAAGISLQLISYNNNENVNTQFAHLGLIEEDTVSLHGIKILNEEGKDVSPIALNYGQTYQVIPGFIPNAALAETSFTSSDETVASIDTDGLITANQAGQATITLTSGVYTQTVTVTVLNPLTGISVEENDVTLTIGTTKTVEVALNPVNYTDTLKFTFSEENIASYTFENNILTIIAQTMGEATLTISSVENPELKIVIAIKVGDIPVSSIDVKEENEIIKSLTITEGETSTLNAVVSPITRLDKTVTWESSDSTVFTVENGVITAVKPGSASLLVKSGNVTETISVTIVAEKPVVSGITVATDKLDLTIGDTSTIDAKLNPTGVEGTITYVSSNDKVATVDASGNVIAIGKGEATIMVTHESYSEAITVTVSAEETQNHTTIIVIVSALVVGVIGAGALIFTRKK